MRFLFSGFNFKISSLVAIAVVLMPAFSGAQTAPASFRDFTGVCQGAGSADLVGEMAGWDRADVPWEKLEPRPGEWNQAELEKWGARVLELKAKGIRFLPLLCYNAMWAIDTKPRVVESNGTRVELQRNEAGAFTKVVSKKNKAGEWLQESAKPVKPRPQWSLAQENVQAWEAYVRRVVSYLSAPPYNIQYFQIWNEAHPTSGFWEFATMDDYMRRIHLPAARVIHELGGKVVYGGWPDCGTLPGYISMLDGHQAWGTIDVHDFHYRSPSVFEQLQAAARQRGLPPLAIWQTEIGFVKNPETIPNQWPRFLAWGLRNNWREADQYKLFWFPAWTPDAPASYGFDRALVHGKALAAHGVALKTLSGLFSAGPVSLYAGKVTSHPALQAEIDLKKSSMEAFAVGPKRIVVAVHLVHPAADAGFASWTGPREGGVPTGKPCVDLSLDGVRPVDIAACRRVDAMNGTTPLRWGLQGTSTATLRVPIPDDLPKPPSPPPATPPKEPPTWTNTFYAEVLLR